MTSPLFFSRLSQNVTKSRTIDFCCPDYEEFEADGKKFCKPICPEKCNWGYCKSPGKCECEIGKGNNKHQNANQLEDSKIRYILNLQVSRVNRAISNVPKTTSEKCAVNTVNAVTLIGKIDNLRIRHELLRF